MDTRMTEVERQAFLAETRVGIICISEEGRGPLAVPVWYNYQPGGEVSVWTGAKTRKGKLLHDGKRISLVVQDPTPPNYRYVSVEGPVSIRPIDLEADIRPMAMRYFGPESGEQYYEDVKKSDGWKNDILVSLTPERWLSVDYSKLEPPNKDLK